MKQAQLAEIRRRRNNAIRSRVKTSVRRLDEALKAADLERATKALSQAFSQLDRAVTKGVIHKNEANRRKARLSLRLEGLKKKAVQA